MTGFAQDWDQALAAELAPVWVTRNYIAGALIDVEELVTVVDAILNAGSSVSIPSVTVAPRVSVPPPAS
jgi:hypothetical protein